MVDTNKLRAMWVAKGQRQPDVARLIDMSQKTFSEK